MSLRAIRFVAAALVGSAYTTMVLGAYVKAIYGGMACPEWPTCLEGQAIPPLDSAQVAAEILHRIAAVTVAAAGLVLLAIEFAHYRKERPLIRLTVAAAGVLAVQIALGAITISSQLAAAVVTAHLAVATLFFGLTLLIAVKVWRLPAAPASAAIGEAEAPRAPAEAEAATKTLGGGVF